jgi:hypothetical protein
MEVRAVLRQVLHRVPSHSLQIQCKNKVGECRITHVGTCLLHLLLTALVPSCSLLHLFLTALASPAREN